MIVCAIVVLCLSFGVGVCAQETKRAGKGSVNGFVSFFSQDISYLGNELSSLRSECGRE